MNMFVARALSAAVFWAGIGVLRGQVMDPITVSFSTVSGEVENSIGVPMTPGGGVLSPVGDSGDDLFLQGDDPDDPSAGLPVDGTIVSASNTADKIATFQLAPYTGSDLLVGDGTLTLATPGSYSNLAFLVNSLSAARFSAPATFTLNFSDGSQTTLGTQENVPYWFGGVPGVAAGSVALSTSVAYDYQSQFFNETPVNFDEYDFVLSSTDAAKTLKSIDVGANGDELVTYAVSGMDPPPAAPEPPSWSLLAMAAAGACLLRRLRARAGA